MRGNRCNTTQTWCNVKGFEKLMRNYIVTELITENNGAFCRVIGPVVLCPCIGFNDPDVEETW